MYEAYYGLKEKPFNLLPDPDFLFMSKSHDNAYTHLEYAISENKGFVVVTGEVGSGKTTLINYLLGKIPQDVNVGLINNTYIPPEQLLKTICREFELPVDGKDKAELLNDFQELLLSRFAAKKRMVLFVDEAQNLSPAAMEEVRLLSNLEAEKEHLIQIILVGQPELRFKLQRSDLRQFAQRVSVHCHLKGLSNGEVNKYIRHRLKAAGARKPDIFQKDAVDLIAQYSGGVPRIINILCDSALVYGFADEQKAIDKGIVASVIDAREAGGILAHGREQAAPVDGEAFGGAGDAPGGVHYEPWIQSLERRLLVLENLTVSMDQRIAEGSLRRDERDQVVVELFKMLKSSIESRQNLVAKFNQLRRQMEVKRKLSVPVVNSNDPLPEKKKSANSLNAGLLWALALVTVLLLSFILFDLLMTP